MNDWINGQVFQSVLRNFAVFVAGTMTANGWFTEDQNTLVVGLIVAAGTLAFSVVSARFKKVATDMAGGKHEVKRVIENKSLLSEK